ncbi:MAG TPA: nicotinate-nucleotide adenylyltransferase [Stellaceae bacterium]|nr:nicotinate-nucleotide adenylyltransferase [Stellaceae bacterium]
MPGPGLPPPRRVGLLGGSFNPAHAGHLHISREALKRLDLDQVWWLVSPQNPLKAKRGMASFARRLAAARAVARHPRIRIVDLEDRLGTRYTVDTLAALERRFPHIGFVWLMGADILVEIRRWKRWPEIFFRTPVAVFARPTYCQRALAGMAAQRFRRHRIAPGAARRLAAMAAPAWTFLWMPLDPSSATAIRSRAPRRRTKRN